MKSRDPVFRAIAGVALRAPIVPFVKAANQLGPEHVTKGAAPTPAALKKDQASREINFYVVFDAGAAVATLPWKNRPSLVVRVFFAPHWWFVCY